LTLKVYRCLNMSCPRFHQPIRPEEEGGWALPHKEFGLDVIALVGTLRYQQQRSIPDIHEELLRRGIMIAQRTVTDQLYHYEELLALYLADTQRLRERLSDQKQVILALDGIQPDVEHEVLWVLRDCCSGEVLVSRSLPGAKENDLVPLLEEAASVCPKLGTSIAGVITDGQRSIRNAVARALPGIPHQLCHFHYLREAAGAKGDYPMDKELEMITVLSKITAALSKSAGHTVEVYKAEESTPPFRVYLTMTEEGDHARVLVHDAKVTVLPLFKEEPENLLWHIEVLRKEIPSLEVEVIPLKREELKETE